MKAYADYEFYVNKYGGKKVEDEDFAAVSLYATQYIKRVTLGRSEHYLGDEIKYATCAVADVYHEIYIKSSNGIVKSENTDGYSVSYAVQVKDGEISEECFLRKAYEQARIWLVGTDLLNRRVGCRHEHVNKL